MKFITSRIFGLFIVLSLFSVNPTKMFSQDSFISEMQIGINQLTPNQAERYGRVTNQESVEWIKFVRVGNLSNYQTNGRLRLTLPGSECTIIVHAKHVESQESGDFYWYGEVATDSGDELSGFCVYSEGTINIMQLDNEVFGTFRIGDDHFELHTVGNRRNILVKKNYDDRILSCGSDEISHEDVTIADTDISDRIGNCPVRVLALYSPNGEDAVPDIINTIHLTIAETNQAFRNSNLSSSDVELVLVDIQEIDFTETTDLTNDVDALINNADAQAFRDAVGADIVVVYVDGNYGLNIGRAGFPLVNAPTAFCVMNAEDALVEYITSHEIAHIFGAHHEPEAFTGGIFEHAHEFRTGWFRRTKRTIMFSLVDRNGGRAIQHYSNPFVNYKKRPTGVVDERHNSRMIKLNGCTVANFRDDLVTPTLYANITGDQLHCPCSSAAVSADVQGGMPGPYQYEWRTSSDGFNWSGVLSTNTSLTINIPCTEGQGVFARLTATSVDGQVSDTFRFFEAALTWSQQEAPCPLRVEERIHQGSEVDINIYPNPVGSQLFIQTNEGDEDAPVQIVDVTGKIYLQQVFETNNNSITVNTQALPEGVYFIKVGENFNQKFYKISEN